VGAVVIGHLGARVSALLDGQLSPQETEEAWAHVYTCHACRDLVEREGWVKTRLAGLSCEPGPAPIDLKGSLLSMPPGDRYLVAPRSGGARRGVGIAVLGGGAVGAAMLGVLALGTAPAGSPPAERRPPVTRIDAPVDTPSASPARRSRPASSRSGPVDQSVAFRQAAPAWVQHLVR
jgi:anti-sigma factor RsiW